MTSSSPLISVILVSFQTGPALFSAIDSVLSQTAPFELIVVNNGNPHEIVKELHRRASADGRLHIIDGHDNVGFGRGNNLGIAASQGTYILMMNPDCKLATGALEKLHQEALKLSQPFMIGARILNEDGTDQRGCRRQLLTPLTAFIEAFHFNRFFPRLRLNLHDEPIPSTTTQIPAISGAFMFLPRHDFDLIQGFDEGYFLHVEDLDFCFRFRRAGGEIYFCPEVVVTHIGGTSQVSSDFIERHKARGFIRYFHRNFNDKYPIFLLWILDILIWMRYFLRKYLKKLTFC